MAGYRPQRMYIAILAAVSGLVLIAGFQFKPTKVLEAPVSQAERLRLQVASQRRSLDDLTSYFSRVADDVKSGLVWLRDLETSGVVWDDRGLIVAAAPLKPLRSAPTAGSYRLSPAVASIHYPVAAFRAPEQAGYRPVFRSSTDSLAQGGWILQVAAKQDDGHLYAPGTFGGVVAAQCGDFRVQALETNLPLDEPAVGSGIFDLSGNLLGVVLRCEAGRKAVTPESIQRILDEANSFAGQLLQRYGFRVEPLTPESMEYFVAERGLLVTETSIGWPAAEAGLMPGDIVQTLDGVPVRTMDDIARLFLPAADPTVDLSIWRNRRAITLPMTVSGEEFPAANKSRGPGITLRPSQEGYPIADVARGSSADLAGIRPGDRVLFVGGSRPRDLAAASNLLFQARGTPVYVVVERGPKRFGAYLR